MHYQAPLWLKGGHAQTVWPALFIHLPRPPYRREVWSTPDGGEIAVDCIDGDGGAPLVVLFHGLEGDSDSHYAKALMLEVQARGWHGAVPHFRGCGGISNTLRRAYHAGDSAEIGWILQRLAESHAVVLTAGVSIGGNMLLKYLGENGRRALPLAAAAISVPVDLAAASAQLDHGLGKVIYTRMFMATLKPKAREQLALHPGLFDAYKLDRAKTFREFDNLVTAPIHGYRDAFDYWDRASSKPFLSRIETPTLVLNAKNDPFLPPSALPLPQDTSRWVTLEQPEEGGHVGFPTGRFPGQLDWLPKRLLAYFDQQLAAGPTP